MHHPEVDIVGEAGSVTAAYDLITRTQPSLVFLDIEIDGGTAFDLISMFPSIFFKIIFVTAFNDYAVKAFRLSALDYLLKPLDSHELSQAIQKAGQHFKNEQQDISLRNLLQVVKNSTGSKKLILQDLSNIYVVDEAEIVRCESDGNYTSFYLSDGRTIVVSKTMKEYAALLNNERFFRIHHSHLINLSFFLRYDKTEGGQVILKDGSSVPVAIRRKDEFLQALKKLAD